MKNLFAVTFLAVLAAASVALFSCNNSKSSKGKLDPSALVYINAAKDIAPLSVATLADSKPDSKQARLSAKEVVLQAENMYAIGYTENPTEKWDMGVADWNRDTANNRIAMSSSCVIDSWGDLSPRFMGAIDLILTTVDERNHPQDTIAYFDNRQMRAAEAKIKAAFAAGDYAACYKLFETAFEFRPITGAEYLELRAQNMQ